MTVAPRSEAGTSASAPWKRPMAVRTPLAMTTDSIERPLPCCAAQQRTGCAAELLPFASAARQAQPARGDDAALHLAGAAFDRVRHAAQETVGEAAVHRARQPS